MGDSNFQHFTGIRALLPSLESMRTAFVNSYRPCRTYLKMRCSCPPGQSIWFCCGLGDVVFDFAVGLEALHVPSRAPRAAFACFFAGSSLGIGPYDLSPSLMTMVFGFTRLDTYARTTLFPAAPLRFLPTSSSSTSWFDPRSVAPHHSPCSTV